MLDDGVRSQVPVASLPCSCLHLTRGKLAVFQGTGFADRLSSRSSNMFLREQSHLCWHGLHQQALWLAFALFLVSYFCDCASSVAPVMMHTCSELYAAVMSS